LSNCSHYIDRGAGRADAARMNFKRYFNLFIELPQNLDHAIEREAIEPHVMDA